MFTDYSALVRCRTGQCPWFYSTGIIIPIFFFGFECSFRGRRTHVEFVLWSLSAKWENKMKVMIKCSCNIILFAMIRTSYAYTTHIYRICTFIHIGFEGQRFMSISIWFLSQRRDEYDTTAWSEIVNYSYIQCAVCTVQYTRTVYVYTKPIMYRTQSTRIACNIKFMCTAHCHWDQMRICSLLILFYNQYCFDMIHLFIFMFFFISLVRHLIAWLLQRHKMHKFSERNNKK